MKKEDSHDKIVDNTAKEVKKVLNEGMPLENKEQYEKIHNIDYVFDDLDQIPNSERKRQYMFPLSGVAASVPFGHKISFADEKNPYIIESASKTYDAKYTLKEMKSLFGFEDWQVKEYVNPGTSVTLMMLFGNIYDNRDVLIKAMESYGWSFAFESSEKIIGNEHWIMLHFDPIYQVRKNSGEITSLHIVKNNNMIKYE